MTTIYVPVPVEERLPPKDTNVILLTSDGVSHYGKYHWNGSFLTISGDFVDAVYWLEKKGIPDEYPVWSESSDFKRGYAECGKQLINLIKGKI